MLSCQEVGMFRQRYSPTNEGRTHHYYALVESVWTDAGSGQHIVAYLGELNHDQERRWQCTVLYHDRLGQEQQRRLFPDDDEVRLPHDPHVARVRLRSVGWSNARRFGDVWLARWLWHRLRLDESLECHPSQGKHTVRSADIVAINRVCAPCSEFVLAEHWYASTALEDVVDVPDSAVTKDRLYRTLEGLQNAKEAIENHLKKQFGILFSSTMTCCRTT